MADVAHGGSPDPAPTSAAPASPAPDPAAPVSGPAGPDSAGLGFAGSGSAGPGSVGLDSAGFGSVGSGSGGGDAAAGAVAVAPDAPVGLPDPAALDKMPRRRSRIPRWVPLTLVITFIAICAIVMLIILGFSNGPKGLAIGLGAAILPVPVLVGCFLWLDRYEPEPSRYLIFCFAWGSAVATLVAIGVNSLAAWGIDKIGLP